MSKVKAKTGKFSKVEEVYIQHSIGKSSTEEIAKDLGRTTKSVEKKILEIIASEPEPPPANKTESGEKKPKVVGNILNQFARRPEHEITIMTPAAAELSDEAGATNRKPFNKFANCVTQVKKD